MINYLTFNLINFINIFRIKLILIYYIYIYINYLNMNPIEFNSKDINDFFENINPIEINCAAINNFFEINDDINGMTLLYATLTLFQNKYKNKPEIIESYFADEFRNDTKIIFNTILNSLPNENEEKNEIYIKEHTEFVECVDNVKYICQNIDTVNLINPDNEFYTKCNNAILYFNQKNREMNELTDTMKLLTKKLDLVAEAFSPIEDVKLKLD